MGRGNFDGERVGLVFGCLAGRIQRRSFQLTCEKDGGAVNVHGGRKSNNISPSLRRLITSAPAAYRMCHAGSSQQCRVEPQGHIDHVFRLRMAQHRTIEAIESLVEHPLRHLHEPDDERPRNRARLAPKVHLEIADVQRDDVSLGRFGECG